ITYILDKVRNFLLSAQLVISNKKKVAHFIQNICDFNSLSTKCVVPSDNTCGASCLLNQFPIDEHIERERLRRISPPNGLEPIQNLFRQEPCTMPNERDSHLIEADQDSMRNKILDRT